MAIEALASITSLRPNCRNFNIVAAPDLVRSPGVDPNSPGLWPWSPGSVSGETGSPLRSVRGGKVWVLDQTARRLKSASFARPALCARPCPANSTPRTCGAGRHFSLDTINFVPYMYFASARNAPAAGPRARPDVRNARPPCPKPSKHGRPDAIARRPEQDKEYFLSKLFLSHSRIAFSQRFCGVGAIRGPSGAKKKQKYRQVCLFWHKRGETAENCEKRRQQRRKYLKAR